MIAIFFTLMILLSKQTKGVNIRAKIAVECIIEASITKTI